MNLGVPAPLLLGLTSETRQRHVTEHPARRLPRGGIVGRCRGPAGARSSPRRPLAPGGSHGCPQGAGTVPEPRRPSRRGLPSPVPLFPPGTPGEGNPPPILLLLPGLPKPLRCLPASARPELQHLPEGKAPAATPGGHGHCHPPEGTWGGHTSLLSPSRTGFCSERLCEHGASLLFRGSPSPGFGGCAGKEGGDGAAN